MKLLMLTAQKYGLANVAPTVVKLLGLEANRYTYSDLIEFLRTGFVLRACPFFIFL